MFLAYRQKRINKLTQIITSAYAREMRAESRKGVNGRYFGYTLPRFPFVEDERYMRKYFQMGRPTAVDATHSLGDHAHPAMLFGKNGEDPVCFSHVPPFEDNCVRRVDAPRGHTELEDQFGVRRQLKLLALFPCKLDRVFVPLRAGLFLYKELVLAVVGFDR